MSDSIETSAWFSIALDYGLSVVSLGKAGSGDEQLLTGGLTAVESLLGPEIGVKQQEGFVVDHKTSRMERFPVDLGEGNRIFAQFFLLAPKGREVETSVVNISKIFIENLSKEFLKSKFWEETQIAAQALLPSQIFDLLLNAYEKTHRAVKIRTDDKRITEVIQNTVLNSFTHYSYSEVLDHLSNLEYQELTDYVDKRRDGLLQRFFNDIIAKVVLDAPLSFLYSSPKLLKTEGFRILQDELEKLKNDQTVHKLNETIEGLFSEDTLHYIMREYDAQSIREKREEIRGAIMDKIQEQILQKAPLITLINPTLKSELGEFQSVIDSKVLDRVYREYDLAAVLSKVAENLIIKADDSERLQGELIGDFFQNLALRFPGGLPDQLWQIVSQLLTIYALEARVNLNKLPEFMEISEAHWKTIEKRIKKYKRFKPSELQFKGESGREVIQFFDGVREAIGRSFHKFYTNVIWDIHKEEFGEYIQLLVTTTKENYQSMQNIYCMTKLLNFMKGKYQYLDPFKVPLDDKKFDLLIENYEGKDSEVISSSYMKHWIPSKISYYFAARAKEILKTEEQAFLSILKQFESYFDNLSTHLEKTKSLSPEKIIIQKQIPLLKPKLELNVDFLIKIVKNTQDQLTVIVSSLDEIRDKFEGFINTIKQDKDAGKIEKKYDKKVGKFLQGIDKQKQKAMEKFKEVKNQVINSISTIEQTIDSEEQKLHKEAEKIWDKTRLRTLKASLEKGQIKGINVNIDQIKNTIVKEENKRFRGDSLLTDQEFLYAYTSVYLFNSLDANIRRKAIDIAIFSPKSSRLISDIIEERKQSDSQMSFDFLESLKEHIVKSGNEVFSLTQLIASLIRKSFSSEDLPLKAFLEREEKLAVEVGTLDLKFDTWLEENVNIHPRVVIEKQKDHDLHVYYEVARRPNVGEIDYLMDAIALSTYNAELNRLGLFIESLKMVASTLGEQERRRVQRLFDSLGNYLTSS
ncbi:MAG: hypothetical protein ACXAC7_08885 [Candidatus Hodarchaeales archaeon]|jgi:hypothetical protein